MPITEQCIVLYRHVSILLFIKYFTKSNFVKIYLNLNTPCKSDDHYKYGISRLISYRIIFFIFQNKVMILAHENCS